VLDQDQQKVVDAGKGIFAVYAGAGSGKTLSLVSRAARLSSLGRTLCLTFTSEAAKNMKSRCEKLFPDSTAEFRTVHSLALQFANEHPDAFPFTLSENPLAGEGVSAKAIFQATKNKVNFKLFSSWISLQKRKRIDPVDAIRIAEKSGKDLNMALMYKDYQRILKNLGVLDFDDLCTNFVDILESRPDIRSKWQYEYILVDEVQDCCEIDWRLLQLLSQKHGNLLATGDSGQSVFGFRGGVSDHFLNMEEIFPGTQKMFLGKNYRSCRKIVEYIRKATPQKELADRLEAMRKEEGVEPSVTGYSNDSREAEGVVDSISKLVPSECAILARTNLSLRSCEETLIERNIPHYLLGGEGYWETEEIRNVLAWVRCVYNPSNNFLLAALQTPFNPTQYIKRKLVAQEIRDKSAKTGQTAWKLLDNYHSKDDHQNRAVAKFMSFLKGLYPYKALPASEAVSRIIKELGCVDHYKEESSICPDKDPVASLKELVRISGKHDSLQDFLNYVRKVAGASRNKKGVCLSTIHSFKGREAPHVFLVSCNEGILPHAKALAEGDLQGEINAFYVAVSRPELTLNISYWGNKSRFLVNLQNKPQDDILR
jgi:DNA helicase-2/ATP-dependent DNA helicase PcrA